MGLLRKAVRRATPRPVKQVKRAVTHPVRATVRAATPKPIRRAERQIFNVTHPVNTLENAVINTVMPRGKRRTKPRSGSSARSSGGRATPPRSPAARQQRPSSRAPSTGPRPVRPLKNARPSPNAWRSSKQAFCPGMLGTSKLRRRRLWRRSGPRSQPCSNGVGGGCRYHRAGERVGAVRLSAGCARHQTARGRGNSSLHVRGSCRRRAEVQAPRASTSEGDDRGAGAGRGRAENAGPSGDARKPAGGSTAKPRMVG